MRIWSSKYALTSGITEHDVNEPDERFPGMIVVEPTQNGNLTTYLHGEGKEWHRSLDAANVRASYMRDKKIAALEKQIKRLRAMRFESP